MFKEIKWFIQRGRRGWSDRDNWGACSHLSNVIIGMVENLQKNHCGCPADLYDGTAKNNECHKWDEILEEIKQGFKAHQEIENTGRSVQWNKKDGIYKTELTNKHEQLAKKFDRGMELFAKYFMNLWD